MAGREELARKYKVIYALGVAGQGKSSTANTICGSTNFNVSTSTEPETDTSSGVITRWRNLNGENPYIVFDTPSIDDLRYRYSNFERITSSMKEMGYVHSFLIILNS